MAYRELLPDARLRGLVRAYWQIEAVHGTGQQEHMFMPERLVRLTFYAGESFWGRPNAALQRMPDAILDGLSLVPQRVVSLGLTRALGAELYPWGARQLLGWDVDHTETDLTRLYPELCREVCALVALNDWDGARDCLEAWLLSLWQARAEETGKGIQAAARLYLSLGNARIGTLAEELNLSARQLERQFARQVGVNAKTLARLIRFEEIHNRLWWHPGASLAALAYDLGFADQAHLTREFRALSHMTPRAFAQITALRRAADLGVQELEWLDATVSDLSSFASALDLPPTLKGEGIPGRQGRFQAGFSGLATGNRFPKPDDVAQAKALSFTPGD